MMRAILTTAAILGFAYAAPAQTTCITGVYGTVQCSNGLTIFPAPTYTPQMTYPGQPPAFVQGLTGGAYALESAERAELLRRQAEQLPPARQCPIGLRWLGVCE